MLIHDIFITMGISVYRQKILISHVGMVSLNCTEKVEVVEKYTLWGEACSAAVLSWGQDDVLFSCNAYIMFIWYLRSSIILQAELGADAVVDSAKIITFRKE